MKFKPDEEIIISNKDHQTNLQTRVLNLDSNDTKGRFNTMFRECIGSGGLFTKEWEIRENDIFLLKLTSLSP